MSRWDNLSKKAKQGFCGRRFGALILCDSKHDPEQTTYSHCQVQPDSRHQRSHAQSGTIEHDCLLQQSCVLANLRLQPKHSPNDRVDMQPVDMEQITCTAMVVSEKDAP